MSKIKILYFCDSHLKGINPRNRIDNYCEAIKAKIVELFDRAKKEKVLLIIFGGDVYDSYLVSNTLSDWFISLTDKYKIDVYITVGNHDELFNNWQLSNSTSLAHMFRRGKYIKQLGEYEDDNVYIKGQEFYVGIEEDLNKKFPQHDKKDKLTIYVPHALIVDASVWFSSCVYYKNIKTNYDIVLISHNHKYWGLQKHDGTQFVAPGAIARCDADEFDMNRTPSIAIIDVKKKSVDITSLKSAKPVEEIFDLKRLAIQKENKNKLEIFTAGLKNVKIQTMKVLDVVLKICETSKSSDDVKNSLRERIGLSERKKNE